MTDTTAANSNDAVNSADNRPAANGPTPSGPAAAASDVTALVKEIADYKDKLLRSLADMENLRRRTDREVADARTYGVSSLARDIVGVADNMRRALQAAGDSGAIIEGPAKALLEGVELTERELIKVLERHGVKKFDPHGAKFDPNPHQAIFEVPHADIPSGAVAQVVQSGYTIGERVLRPAMVGVSKGGPRAAPMEPSADEKQSG